jgi:hypothetical protein
LGQPGSGGRSKRTYQVIAIEVEQFFIVHADSLSHLSAA